MVEFVSWFKGAGLDEILLFLFLFMGAAVIRVLLYLGTTVKEQHDKAVAQQTEMVNAVVKRFEKAVDMIGERLEKLDTSLNSLTAVVMDIKGELHMEISRIEMRVAVAEKDIQHHENQLEKVVERRLENRQ